MRRELPARPHLDHLKTQAKDLLRAYQRRDIEALARFRASLPAAARLSDEEIVTAGFALHDAQSVLAREHGYPSFQELKAAIESRAQDPFPEGLVRALTPIEVSKELAVALREAWSRRSLGAAASGGLPGTLPFVPIRGAFVVPGSLVPIHVGRSRSLRAVEAALSSASSTLAIFAQRRPADDVVDLDGIHPIGCEAVIRARVPDGTDLLWVVLEGQRWIVADAIESRDEPYQIARIRGFSVEGSAPGAEDEAASLARSLRERARAFARALPDAEASIRAIDAIEDPLRLADLVVANLPCAVDDKARYAAVASLPARLRIAVELSDELLGVRGRGVEI